MLSTSLVEMRLTYIATCSMSVLFSIFRLVTAEQSYAVACSRLEKAMDISMALFDITALL